MVVVVVFKVVEEVGFDVLIVVLLFDGGWGYMLKIFNDVWMLFYGFLCSCFDGLIE